MTKLHLGCGTRYLDGYVNVDFPSSEHSVQSGLKADRYADIVTLEYPIGSIDEIRLHHVFEHFPRQTAMALLCRWNDWLKPDGMLWIETPDVMTSARDLVLPWTSHQTRQQIIRHLFGSHEAGWAIHWDGWYEERFRATLLALGFKDLEIKKTKWGATRNIEVQAKRGNSTLSIDGYRLIAEKILKESLITHSVGTESQAVAESEIKMLHVWLHEWEATYRGQHMAVGRGIEKVKS